ncbi:MAG: hypothetical protein KJ945_18765 [Gammaproteobacteria bacterium]|nr:hypothetical protein [Gammaproteobacteria bacterium]MBU0839335.1 hypothetical protein [Gammaproteobacteria bacterium]MBU1803624.1 hypothetical protein [Gammaproteobacteria bacterium]
MATATLHVHPTCASNRSLIERLQAATGLLVVISNGKPRLKAGVNAPTTPINPWGGDAA